MAKVKTDFRHVFRRLIVEIPLAWALYKLLWWAWFIAGVLVGELHI